MALSDIHTSVAHNAAFHVHQSRDEIVRPARAHQACLLHMKGYRALDLGGSASLSAVCRHIKLARAGDLHDAIEDAWLAMQIYLWLHGCPLQRRLRRSLPRTPSNFRHPTTRPYRDQQGLRRFRRSVTEPGRLLPCRSTLIFVTMDGRRAAQRLHPAQRAFMKLL